VEPALPFIDVHSVAVGATAERVWDVLVRRAPRVGFRVAREKRPALLALEGEHLFARYALTFRIDPVAREESRLTAETHAAFPGATGRVYRQLVIGSGGHTIVVRHLLREIKRRAERAG
jgi:hypothetical protein